MVYDEHQQEDSLTQSHVDAQDNPPASSLEAARTCLTKLLSSRTLHERQIAVGEMENHLLIVERWARDMGGSATAVQAEITKMKVQRNAVVPIHALPNEIFTCIFLICLRPTTWSPNKNIRLRSVCSAWKTFLENGSLFWPKLRSKYSQPMLELVLRRNHLGPLRIVCSKQEAARRKSEFLELAAPHSMRWYNLTFKGAVCNVVKEQLQVSTPDLTELYVFNSDGIRSGSTRLALSDGKPLRHAFLYNVAIPWDTSRLRGLRSLQLNNLRRDSPTLSQLHTVLVASPELWYLRLSQLVKPLEDTADMLNTPPIISLPALSTLFLEAIPESFVLHLLTRTQAPVCSCIVASNVPFSVVTNLTFQTLIAPSLQVSDGLLITSYDSTISIKSQPPPQVTLHWVHSIRETVGIKISFRPGASGAQFSEELQAVLNTAMLHAPSKLTVSFSPSTPFSPFPTIPASELLRLLPSTKAIECHRHSNCQAVLQYLVTAEEGGSGFPCPDLESLTLSHNGDAEVELLQTLLRLRRDPSQLPSQRDDESVRPLKRLHARQSVLETLEKDGLLEGLETCRV